MLFLGNTAFNDLTLCIYVLDNGLYRVEEHVQDEMTYAQNDLTRDQLLTLYRAFDLEGLDWDRIEMIPKMAS